MGPDRYWDYLSQLNSDFFSSKRDIAAIKYFFNEEGLTIAVTLQNYYFRTCITALSSQLESDIKSL